MGKFLAVASFHNNPDEHIDLTFDNVLKQTHKDWLLIVADDGSKDPEFRRRLRKRVEALNDKRIIYYHLENRRELYLYQNTFQHLEYDYYFDLDTDDILDRELFEIYDKHFQKYPQVYSIFTDYLQKTPEGGLEQWSLVEPADNFASEWKFRHHSEFWEIYSNRNTQRAFGAGRAMRRPDENSLPIIKECKTSTDTFFLFYNLARGKHLHIPRNLYTYVRRPGSDSGAMSEQEHADFNVNATPFIEGCPPHNTLFIYDDVWHITSAIQTTDWLNSAGEFSVHTEEPVSEDQQAKVRYLYPNKKIKFNEPHENIIIAWKSEDLSPITNIGNDFKRLSLLAFKDATGDKTTEEDLNQWTDKIKTQAQAIWSDGGWYSLFRQFRYTIDRVGDKPQCRFYHRMGPELHCDWAPENNIYRAELWLKGKMYHKVNLGTGVWMRYAMDWYEKWECRIVKNSNDEVVETLVPNESTFGVSIESSSLGDTISWMGQIEELKQQRDYDKIYVHLHRPELFDWEYYDSIGIHFAPVTSSTWPDNWQTVGVYQTEEQPSVKHKHKRDWRTITLGAIAADQLGINYVERKPRMARRFYLDTLIKPEEGNSVCIGPRGTAGAKEWQRPGAWQTIIDKFKAANWNVHYCSKEETNLTGIEMVSDGGQGSIFKVGQQMRKSGYFIGIGSGLSWLAWALDVKVCLISGFTWEFVEFDADIRIINKNVCSGCWTYRVFDRGDWDWCPEHKNTPRHFECTKTITPEYVWQELEEANWI